MMFFVLAVRFSAPASLSGQEPWEEACFGFCSFMLTRSWRNVEEDPEASDRVALDQHQPTSQTHQGHQKGCFS